MKFLLFYSVVFVAVLAAISPLTLLASSGWSIDKPVRREWTNTVSKMFQDSTSVRKKSPDIHKEVQKPPQDDRDERLKEAQTREIKQVPRSIPKLKPQPVSEGLKIRRPPNNAPKKGMGKYRFNAIGSVS